VRFSFARLFRRLGIHPMVLYSISSTAEIRTIETRIPVVSSEVTPKNVQDVRDMRDGPVGKKFRKFLAEGDTGLYAMLGTKVIGHVWSRVCTGDSLRVDGLLGLHRGEAIIHFAMVREEYRGNNIYPYLLSVLSRKLFLEDNVRRVSILAEADNLPSRRGIEKAGFTRSGELTRLPYHRLIEVWDSAFHAVFHSARNR